MILVTCGNFYISSHIIIQLLQNNYNCIALDLPNEYNSKITKITGKSPIIYPTSNLEEIFATHHISTVIYLTDNTCGNYLDLTSQNVSFTVKLLQLMKSYNVKNLIYQSTNKVSAISTPFVQSIKIVEQILEEECQQNNFNITVLRCSNPIGNHCSGEIGDTNSNILPTLMKVVHQQDSMYYFGDEYRFFTVKSDNLHNYIHIEDMAQAFLYALQSFKDYKIYDVGSDIYLTPQQLCEIAVKITGVDITTKKEIVQQKNIGCDTEKIRKELGWIAKKTVEDAVKDSWKYQQTQKLEFIVCGKN